MPFQAAEVNACGFDGYLIVTPVKAGCKQVMVREATFGTTRIGFAGRLYAFHSDTSPVVRTPFFGCC